MTKQSRKGQQAPQTKKSPTSHQGTYYNKYLIKTLCINLLITQIELPRSNVAPDYTVGSGITPDHVHTNSRALPPVGTYTTP